MSLPPNTPQPRVDPVETPREDTLHSRSGSPTQTIPLPADLPFDAPSQPGDLGTFSGYRILKLLGVGGMGAVFQAEETILQRPVAIKIMKSDVANKPEAKDRFLREARAAASLKSDYITTIYQVGEVRGVPYLAMELLDGSAMDDWLKTQPRQLPEADVTRIAQDVLSGLVTAQAKGLVHRDIKPANLWMEASTGRVKLLDFGLTRPTTGEQITQSGAIVGTPAYMAPEQAEGLPVDGRADLFSLGVILYRLLTGVNPFQREGMMSTLTALATYTPPLISQTRPDVSPSLAFFVHRLMDKNPANRPATAALALQELMSINTRNLLLSAPTPQVVHTAPIDPFADIDDTSTVMVAPVRKPKTQAISKSKPPYLLWGLLLGGAAMLLMAIIGGIIIVIKYKDGTIINIEVPEGAKVEFTSSGKTAPTGKGKPTVTPTPPTGFFKPGEVQLIEPLRQLRPEKVFTLDHLDPARFVPPAEKFAFQPPELVAVLGSHRQRTMTSAGRLVLSPNGKIIACDNKMWDATTLQERESTRLNAFSPSGKLAAHQNYIWYVDEPNKPHKQSKLYRSIEDFITEDIWLVTTFQNEWNIWRNETERWIQASTFPKAQWAVVSPDKKYVAVRPLNSNDVEVYAINADGVAKDMRKLPGPEGQLSNQYYDGPMVSFSANGLLAIISQQVTLWDIKPAVPKLLTKLPAEPADRQPVVLCLAANGEKLVALSEFTGRIYSKKGDTFEAKGKFPFLTASYSNIAGPPLLFQDNKRLATTHLNQTVRFWDIREDEFKEINPPLPSPTLFNSMTSYSPDGKFCTTQDENSNSFLLNFDSLIFSKLAEYTFTRTLIHPNSTKIVSGEASPQNHLLFRDVAQLQDGVKVFTDFNRPCCYSPDGKWLVTQGFQPANGWCLWDVSVSPAKQLFTRKDVAEELSQWKFTPDQKYLIASGHYTKQVHIWRFDAVGQPEQLPPFEQFQSDWAMSPDGRTFAFTHSGTGSGLFSFKEGKFTPIEMPKWRANWCDFSSDGRFLARDGISCVEILDLNTKEVIHKIPLRTTPLAGRFHPDGKHLLITNPDRTTYILRIPQEVLAKLGRPHVVEQKLIDLALNNNYIVYVNDNKTPITKREDLPPKPFRLTGLEIRSHQLTNNDISPIQHCQDISSLVIGGNPFNDEGLKGFDKLTRLTRLVLDGTGITNEGLKPFHQLSSLEELNVSDTATGTEGLRGFASLEKLKFLEVSQTFADNRTLELLKKSLGLMHLFVNSNTIDDDGLVHLKNHEILSTLRLAGTKITGKGFADWKSTDTLHKLELSASLMNDEGLVPLARFKKLEEVNLTDTRVTEAGVKKLKEALPNCKITWSGGVK